MTTNKPVRLFSGQVIVTKRTNQYFEVFDSVCDQRADTETVQTDQYNYYIFVAVLADGVYKVKNRVKVNDVILDEILVLKYIEHSERIIPNEPLRLIQRDEQFEHNSKHL